MQILKNLNSRIIMWKLTILETFGEAIQYSIMIKNRRSANLKLTKRIFQTDILINFMNSWNRHGIRNGSRWISIGFKSTNISLLMKRKKILRLHTQRISLSNSHLKMPLEFRTTKQQDLLPVDHQSQVKWTKMEHLSQAKCLLDNLDPRVLQVQEHYINKLNLKMLNIQLNLNNLYPLEFKETHNNLTLLWISSRYKIEDRDKGHYLQDLSNSQYHHSTCSSSKTKG